MALVIMALGDCLYHHPEAVPCRSRSGGHLCACLFHGDAASRCTSSAETRREHWCLRPWLRGMFLLTGMRNAHQSLVAADMAYHTIDADR